MICAHCSTPVADEARFCHSCGSLVSDAEGQAAATAAMDQSSFLHMERLLREDTKGVYNVQHMLGRGGMAVVYLANEIGLSRKVALKVLPPELTFGHGVERFKREARTAAALDHPNIIPIFRIGDSGKLFWYAMKYLEGKSLEDLLREKGSMSLSESVEILEQVADALDYAHEHKVIHRDVKPANVMLDNRNRVIVTDFGIAKALSEGKLTATDSVIGTPYFMSPEQGMGKTVSGASDQYSVAVMAYRMLAGHVPFDGDSAIDILHKHCMFEAPALHDDVPTIPAHVSKAVARALSKNGDERFTTVHEFIMALKDPGFVPKAVARPSVATVMMDPAEARKLRTGKPVASGKGKTVAAKPVASDAEGTVVAKSSGARVGAPSAAVTAPAPKSRGGLIAVIALVAVAGGGIGYWQLSKPNPATNPSSAQSSNAGVGAIPPATPAVTTAPPPDTTPTKAADAGATNPASAETKLPAADTKAAAKAPPRTNTPARQTATRQTTPANTPANNPASAPANATGNPTTNPTPVQSPPPANTPVTSASVGRLQLTISPPGTLEIDGRDYGEKARFPIDLPEGTHVIRVRKDGYATLTETVEIKAGTPTTLRLTLVPRP